jgi:hypothetical protein
VGEAERRWLDAGQGGLEMEEDSGGVKVKIMSKRKDTRFLE